MTADDRHGEHHAPGARPPPADAAPGREQHDRPEHHQRAPSRPGRMPSATRWTSWSPRVTATHGRGHDGADGTQRAPPRPSQPPSARSTPDSTTSTTHPARQQRRGGRRPPASEAHGRSRRVPHERAVLDDGDAPALTPGVGGDDDVGERPPGGGTGRGRPRWRRRRPRSPGEPGVERLAGPGPERPAPGGGVAQQVVARGRGPGRRRRTPAAAGPATSTTRPGRRAGRRSPRAARSGAAEERGGQPVAAARSGPVRSATARADAGVLGAVLGDGGAARPRWTAGAPRARRGRRAGRRSPTGRGGARRCWSWPGTLAAGDVVGRRAAEPSGAAHPGGAAGRASYPGVRPAPGDRGVTTRPAPAS